MRFYRYRKNETANTSVKENRQFGLALVSIVIASLSACISVSAFVYPNFVIDRNLTASVIQIDTHENGKVLVDIAYINDGNVDEVILGQKLIFTDNYEAFSYSDLEKDDKLEPIVLEPGDARVVRFEENFHKDFLADFKSKEKTEMAKYPYIRAGVEVSLIDRKGEFYTVKYMGAIASRLDDYAVVMNFGATSVNGSIFSLNEEAVIK